MNEELYHFFTNDHRRVESILEAAIKNIHCIDEALYHSFRIGLLTHIKMEEKVLFPASQLANDNQPLEFQEQLRLEHGAITTLMVPTPTPDIIKVLKYVLEAHDELEEKKGGMYELCAKLTVSQTAEIIKELQNVTPVPVHPHKDNEFVMSVVRRSLERAGYDYDEILSR